MAAAGGPIGAMAGASTGKFASDSLQWLFGDKKTPEQRKMEETLSTAWSWTMTSTPITLRLKDDHSRRD